MGNPSNMHIRIPRPIARAKPITASWLNELRDAVQALNEKGLSIPSQQTRKVDPPRFNPLSIRKIVDGETVTFGVKVGFGVVVEIIPKGGEGVDATSEHIPFITPAPTDEEPSPEPVALDGTQEIIIGDGDTVFIRYQTDDMGFIFGEPGEGEDDRRPTIGFDAAPPSSVHYQPPNPGDSEGTEGDYHVKLFSISENPDSKATEIEYFCQSDIFHYHELWRGENLGAGAEVFKKRDAPEDVYQFRTLEGRYGIQEEQNEDDIKLDFWGENVGDGCPVFVEDEDGPEDGPAQFRTIKQRPTQPQVTVLCEPANPGDPLPDAITVQGNGVDGSLVTVDCDDVETTILQWADGLITTSGEVRINLGECQGTETEPPPP